MELKEFFGGDEPPRVWPDDEASGQPWYPTVGMTHSDDYGFIPLDGGQRVIVFLMPPYGEELSYADVSVWYPGERRWEYKDESTVQYALKSGQSASELSFNPLPTLIDAWERYEDK